MFFTLSYTAHVIFSILLHISGVTCGLFIWYLFPRNPYKTITKMPQEKSLLVREENELPEEDDYNPKQKSRLIRASG